MLKTTLLIIVFLFRMALFGQPITVLFQDVDIKEKIIQLEIAPEYQNEIFSIGLIKDDKLVASSELFFASNPYFDIRDLKNADSAIDLIIADLPQNAFLNQTLKTPGIREELSILFSKSHFGLRTVNFVKDKLFLGYRYTFIILIGLLILYPTLLFAFKQSYLKAGLISLFTGFILLDLPNINDQIVAYQVVEKQYPLIDVAASTQQFIKAIKPRIQGQKWRFQGEIRNEYQKLFLKYSLADIEYAVKKKGKKYPKGTYLITQGRPKRNQGLIYGKHGLRLLIQE